MKSVVVVKKYQLLPLEVVVEITLVQLWKEDTQKTKRKQMVSVLKQLQRDQHHVNLIYLKMTVYLKILLK